ncbi:hypothetical protein LguiA_005425 [Lonicera macranthoides]
MDENSAAIEALLNEDNISSQFNGDHGWKTVSYHKKNRKQPAKKPETFSDHRKVGTTSSGDVFRSIEQHSEERRRRLLEAQVEAGAGENSAANDDGEGGSDAETPAPENGNGEVRKSKPKKAKKPKVTVAEAASKIDASDLAAFLADITVSYESQQDIQIMRFADYFGRAFASVNASQFPWVKTLKESSVAKMVDIPLSHVSEAVYKTSVDWLNQRSSEALGPFLLWSLDGVLSDLALHQGAAKGSKKAVQQISSKSQVAIFMVLAMVLRCKPDVLLSVLPTLKENSKYQGQDKLPVLVWLITQAYQGDLVVGLFTWVHFLLPMMSSKSSCNPQSRDLILQMVERIVSSPKARTILLNGAVRKGERLVPPPALDLLARFTFPAPSARVKATERFEAVYPVLKDVALAVSPGSKAMKQLTLQIMNFAIKAAGEGISPLSSEGSDIFVWCLTQNPDCYEQWDNIYMDNLEASVVILRKLSNEVKVHSAKSPSLEHLKATLKSFRDKSKKALASENNADRQAILKESEKHCKMIMGRLSRGHGCVKSVVLLTVALAVGAALLSKDVPNLDLKKLLVDFNLPY